MAFIVTEIHADTAQSRVSLPIPREAYFMAGAGEQRTIRMPLYDMVVVRLRHSRGALASTLALQRALGTRMKVVQPSPSTRTAPA